MVNRVGGGIFALRRPRPYSRAFAGISLRGIAAPTTIYAHGHQWEGVKADHDAARHVATVFEKWDCEIKTVLPSRSGP